MDENIRTHLIGPNHDNDQVLTKNLEFWMTRLPGALKKIPLINLAIPGSHNTMTYTINRFNDVGPDEPASLQFFGKYFSIISKPLIFNWSVTQYDDVVQQLNGGVRYLDFRLATKARNNDNDIERNDDDVYFLHGLYGDEVTQHLVEINHWLLSHPGEIVIIDCQHFYSFSERVHGKFVSKLKNIFKNLMCPSTVNLWKVTLEWMVNYRYQVIIIYRNEIIRKEINFWPSGLWPTPWPDTTRPRALVDFLDMRLKTRLADTGFVSQCLLTPDARYILKHLCGSLHRDLAEVCRKTSLDWIRRHAPGAGGLNIVITDYVSYNNFMFSRVVIQRNALLMDNCGKFLDTFGQHPCQEL
ncbi:PI-PLC X domain-containing protein 3 isoform X1 [Microplitis demolitor]|uniref:PI-PLC X domain-containing protein 3 isoform X1 n=1 Tax=Microplitis demolitor TaxID=69319 RepID=UPI0004CD7119|nr:PI-PLC X domain-containing protein 3 isoform X1 [Microplitis demolitor]